MSACSVGGNDTMIREAMRLDFSTITEIYAGHVRSGTTSFEIIPPDEKEFVRRWQAIANQGLPFFVAMRGGEVRGYAYARPYRPRLAYQYALEHSIYVARDDARTGLGGLLIEALIARCTALGYRQMIAVIGDSANHPSIGFHTKHGFLPAGVLPAVGRKFHRWVDSVLMVRPLGDGNTSAPYGR